MDRNRLPEDPEAWHLTDDLNTEKGKGDPFAAAIRATRMPMVITNPRLPDNPIVFVNDAFLRLTGYGRDEVVGRNCRFLQGPETDAATVAEIQDAVARRVDIATDILNYRKDGSTFWNALFISPVTNEEGEVQFFFASQVDFSERREAQGLMQAEKDRFERAVKDRTVQLEKALEAKNVLLHEVDHRVKNNLQMISSLIVLQLRKIPDQPIRDSLTAMLERVEALSTVHRRLYQSDDVSRFNIAEFIRDLVRDLVATSPAQVTPSFDLDPIEIPAEQAAPVALIINELVTNALKHAFPIDGEGTISLSVKRLDDRFHITVADDGVGMAGKPDGSTFGATLVKALARQLDGTVEWKFGDGHPGTAAMISIPVERAPRKQ